MAPFLQIAHNHHTVELVFYLAVYNKQKYARGEFDILKEAAVIIWWARSLPGMWDGVCGSLICHRQADQLLPHQS